MNCVDALVKSGSFPEVPGFSKSESAAAVCGACRYSKGYDERVGPTPAAIAKARTTQWPNLSKSVMGGLQHMVSVDNAAGYAELWFQGGSWYAVTDAKLSRAFDSGATKSGIYEVAGITKGMRAGEATTRFLEATFGPLRLAKSGGCGCGR